MLIHQFPDIQWLKKKIREGFSDKTALNNVQLKHTGWPNVVLNTQIKQAERRDIKGPFSLFMNLRGKSTVQLDGKTFNLNEQCYAISNHGQHYDLIIDESHATETFNIHFGEHFYRKSLFVLNSTHPKLLDNPFEESPSELNLVLYTRPRDETLNDLVTQLITSYQYDMVEEREEEMLFSLLEEILTSNMSDISRIDAIPALSSANREEIAKRLLIARDLIHSCYNQSLSLDEISNVSCLSKFHFLRLFKAFFGLTPYQYQKQLRFSRALSLYRQGNTLEAIAPQIGMENASSVSRMFKKQANAYPSQLVD